MYFSDAAVSVPRIVHRRPRRRMPAAAIAAIRTGLKTWRPTSRCRRRMTWGQRFGRRTAEPRLLMTILVFFGALAALLAALGVYGLFSWSVALRRRELAIRLTLGAKPEPGRRTGDPSERDPRRRRPGGRPRGSSAPREGILTHVLSRGVTDRHAIDRRRQRAAARGRDARLRTGGDARDAGRSGRRASRRVARQPEGHR